MYSNPVFRFTGLFSKLKKIMTTNYDKQALEFLLEPLKKNAGLQVNVKRFFTDVNGTVLDKNDISIPDTLKVQYPFWIFGQYDRLGGYYIGNQINPPLNTPYIGTFVIGVDMPFLFATGLNTIQTLCKIGDIVHVFTNDINAPTFYIFIVISGGGASISSITANSIVPQDKQIKIKAFNYFVYSNGLPALQFGQNVNLTRIDSLGSYENKPKNILSFDHPENYQGYFVTVPLEMFVDQYNLISSYLAFEADEIQFSFKILKNTIKV